MTLFEQTLQALDDLRFVVGMDYFDVIPAKLRSRFVSEKGFELWRHKGKVACSVRCPDHLRDILDQIPIFGFRLFAFGGLNLKILQNCLAMLQTVSKPK